MSQEHQIVLDVHNELVTNLASLLTQTSPSTTAHPYNLHKPLHGTTFINVTPCFP